jgi:hypothetical protein
MSEESEELVTIRVNKQLVDKIIEKMGWNKSLPVTYAVDQALREMLEVKQ